MTTNSNLIIRSAEPNDCAVIFEMVQGLAEYEKLSHTVTGDAEKLHQHSFGSPKYIETILAEIAGVPVGFAMFFHNYSSYLTKPGIYLEDIYIIPEYRQQGIGKALLIKVAQIAVERDCGRMEWNVLDWNVSAQEFYYRMGAEMVEDWRICRLNRENLIKLANQ